MTCRLALIQSNLEEFGTFSKIDSTVARFTRESSLDLSCKRRFK